MPASFGAAGALASDSLSTITPALPSGLASGHLMLAQVYGTGSSTHTCNDPEWTQVHSVLDTTVSNRLSVWAKPWVSGDAAPSFTTGGTAHGAISRWSGAYLDAFDGVAVDDQGSGLAPSAASITTTRANSAAVYFWAQDDNWTLGTPTGGASLAYGGASYSTSTGGDACMAAAIETVAAAGASGTSAVASGGTGVSQAWCSITIALFEVPSKPNVILGIGQSDGQNHYEVEIGQPGNGAPIDTTPANIAAGHEQRPWWQSVIDASNVVWVQHRTQIDAGTTGGTVYPRTELREYNEAGTTEAAWNPASNTHYIRGRSRITHFPASDVKPSVVLAQVHDGTSDAVQLLHRKTGGGVRELIWRIDGVDVDTPQALSPYTLGTDVVWMIEVLPSMIGTGQDLFCYCQDLFTPSLIRRGLSWSGASRYFKFGAYSQTNETIDSPATEYVETLVRQPMTWHTGDPAPAVPSGLSTVSAGADTSGTAGTVFNRTATDTGTVLNRRWVVVDGPRDMGVTIGTAAALAWTPPTGGTYRLRYGAELADGWNVDDMVLTVASGPLIGPPPRPGARRYRHLLVR